MFRIVYIAAVLRKNVAISIVYTRFVYMYAVEKLLCVYVENYTYIARIVCWIYILSLLTFD